VHVCVYPGSVSVGRDPAVLIITGVSDMSQFPHLGMTCPRPGNTEQMQQDVCVKVCVCVCVRLCMSVFISVCVTLSAWGSVSVYLCKFMCVCVFMAPVGMASCE